MSCFGSFSCIQSVERDAEWALCVLNFQKILSGSYDAGLMGCG